VPASPVDPDGVTPAELQERLAAQRLGTPFLLYRDGAGAQRIVDLSGAAVRLAVGRAPGCEIALEWDGKVSGTHAQLERLGGGEWTVDDDGLSRNGSFVNGERLMRRRRLADGDVVRVGDTAIVFHSPLGGQIVETIPVSGSAGAGGGAEIEISPAQRRVLVALCRPFAAGDDFATPASNQAVADELVVSVEAVKTHMRALFERFGVGDLPRQAKRSELVKRAFQSGTVASRDLE
jgi:pSer/pThr/pTyr-binding forkhead associated (FHA) protein